MTVCDEGLCNPPALGLFATESELLGKNSAQTAVGDGSPLTEPQHVCSVTHLLDPHYNHSIY